MANSAALRSAGHAVLVGSLACSLSACTQEPREAPPLDCSVEDAYEFHPIFLPANGADGVPDAMTKLAEFNNWYSAGDLHAALPDVPAYADRFDFDGEVCGHTLGKRFAFGLNHDWGAVGGRWEALAPEDRDASAYEGFSFWALSLYDRSIELNWSDVTSADPPNGTCIPENVTDPVTMAKNPSPDFVDENGIPVANGCGSLFSRRVVLSKGWTFYTFPFTDFIQIRLDPRFNPEGLDTSAMRLFSFRVPKDAFVDVSFANFAWYRRSSN